jgi:hypothetical protein
VLIAGRIRGELYVHLIPDKGEYFLAKLYFLKLLHEIKRERLEKNKVKRRAEIDVSLQSVTIYLHSRSPWSNKLKVTLLGLCSYSLREQSVLELRAA